MANLSLKIKSLWEYVKPPLVLAAICLVCCGLVVVAYNLTYVDTAGIITDNLQSGCETVLGQGKYSMLIDTNADGEEVPVTYEKGINSIIVDDKQQVAFEVTVDGYAKDGLHLLIGIDKDGAVSGIHVLSLAETPGLGTKINTPAFLNQFVGAIAKREDTDAQTFATEDMVDGISGATYSSKGVTQAVTLVLDTYSAKKGEILGG